MSKRMRNPNELFVGDLSFFCQEQHLLEAFSTFGPVSEARIKRSDRGNRTLMYGFVRMEELKHALQAASEMNGKLYMGRAMRVQLSLTNTYYDSNVKNKVGFQVHVTITSRFPYGKAKDPHEGIIRGLLEPFGTIADVIIKEYKDHKDENKQIGYAFVTFANGPEAKAAVEGCPVVEVDGVRFEFSLSRRAHEQINGLTTAPGDIPNARDDQSSDGDTLSSPNDPVDTTEPNSPTSRSLSSHHSKDANSQGRQSAETNALSNEFFTDVFGSQPAEKLSFNIQKNTMQPPSEIGAPPGLVPRMTLSSPSITEAQLPKEVSFLGNSLDSLSSNNFDLLLFPNTVERNQATPFPSFSNDLFNIPDSLLSRSPNNTTGYKVSPPMSSSSALDSLFAQDPMPLHPHQHHEYQRAHQSKVNLQRVVESMPYLSLQQVPTSANRHPSQQQGYNLAAPDRGMPMSRMNNAGPGYRAPPSQQQQQQQQQHLYVAPNQYLHQQAQEQHLSPNMTYRDFPAPPAYEDERNRHQQPKSRPNSFLAERIDPYVYQPARPHGHHLQLMEEEPFRRLSPPPPFQSKHPSFPFQQSAAHQHQQQQPPPQHLSQPARVFPSQHHHKQQQSQQLQQPHQLPYPNPSSQPQPQHFANHAYPMAPNPKFSPTTSSRSLSQQHHTPAASNPHVYHATTATFRYQL